MKVLIIENKAQKVINKLAKFNQNSIEMEILSQIFFSIQRLEDGNFELLDIKDIKGEKNKGIKEIRIKTPLNYRIFFIEIKDEIHVLDIKPKKRDKFPQSYYDTLINMIKRILRMINSVLLLFFYINKI